LAARIYSPFIFIVLIDIMQKCIEKENPVMQFCIAFCLFWG
jgi:hypothetical protein